MSRAPKTAIFLQRAGYRQRRLRDAAKLLPFLGILLWALPLAWPTASDAEAAVAGSAGLIYIFGVWVVLIVVTAILASRMRADRDAGTPEDAQSE